MNERPLPGSGWSGLNDHLWVVAAAKLSVDSRPKSVVR